MRSFQYIKLSRRKSTDLQRFCSYGLPILVCTWRLCERPGSDQQRPMNGSYILIIHLLRFERYSSRPFWRLLMMVVVKPGSKVWTARSSHSGRSKPWRGCPGSSKRTNRTTISLRPLWCFARTRVNATRLQSTLGVLRSLHNSLPAFGEGVR